MWHVLTLCAQTPLYQALGMSTRITICSCLCNAFGGFLVWAESYRIWFLLVYTMLVYVYLLLTGLWSPTTWFHFVVCLRLLLLCQ